MQQRRIIAGAVIWVLLIAVGIWFFKYRATRANERAIDQLISYSKGPGQFVELTTDQPVLMAINDPVFMIDNTGEYKRVGQIHRIRIAEGTPVYINHRKEELTDVGEAEWCVAKFYNSTPLITDDCTVTMHETPASLEWIINEMTKDGAWDDYEQELAEAFKTHSAELLTEFRPVLESALKESAVVVAEDMKVAFDKRRDRIDAIADRYKNDLVKEKIVPLIQEEILPIVRERAEPTVTQVGMEIWQRASVWRFGWRLAYDKMPLPKRDLAEKEWERFVENEVTPVMESHVDDFLLVLNEIVTDVAHNERVRTVFKDGIEEIVNDPEVKELFEEIMIEVFVENPRLHQVIRDHLESEQTQKTLSVAAARFQETMRLISEKMFGTPQTKITPAFARVLRNQVLRKDSRWFVVHFPENPSPDATPAKELSFTMGETTNENPFVKASEIPEPKY